MLRHYKGSQRRDVAREQQLKAQIDLSAQVLARVAATSHYSPSQSAAHREAAVLLADALATLPQHYREALVLHHLEQRPLAEVAQQMDRTTDSVKQLLARASSDCVGKWKVSHEIITSDIDHPLKPVEHSRDSRCRATTDRCVSRIPRGSGLGQDIGLRRISREARRHPVRARRLS